jgi:hypothetical protein
MVSPVEESGAISAIAQPRQTTAEKSGAEKQFNAEW